MDPNDLGMEGKRFFDFAKERIKGQDAAIRRLAKAIDQHESGLRIPNRPIYTVLVVGGSGSGKTLLAQALAEFWFKSSSAFTEIPCWQLSELKLSQSLIDRHDYIHQLTDADSKDREILGKYNNLANKKLALEEKMQKFGGFRDDSMEQDYEIFNKEFQEFYFKIKSQILDKLRSIVVFDHVEEIKPGMQNLFLEILEKGRLPLDGGPEISFKNSVIFIMSNDCVTDQEGGGQVRNKIGFGKDRVQTSNNDKTIYLATIEEVKRYFQAKFLSRLDRVEILRKYSKETLLEILELLIKDFQIEIGSGDFPIILSLDRKVKEFIIQEGSDHPELGIWLLKKKFDKYIRSGLANLKTKNLIKEKDSLIAVLKDNVPKKSVIFQKEAAD